MNLKFKGIAVAALAMALVITGGGATAFASGTPQVATPIVSSSSVDFSSQSVVNAVAHPKMLGVTTSGGNPFLVLNHADQEALHSGNIAYIEFFLTTAVCALPFVGPIACIDIGFAVTTIQNYLTEHGICSRSRSLYVPLVAGTIVPPLPLNRAFCR